MAEEHLRCYEDMNKGRFESFTDGVFAFTLLILGIALPMMRDPSDGRIVYIPHGVDADVR